MLDIVVFGATGFVGRLVAEYLLANKPEGVTVGLAGRSREKLERLGLDAPLIVADADEPRELARSARVVCTTVGPYWPKGLKLVDARIARHALLRPDRRAPVRARERRASRGGAEGGRADRAQRRLRLDPVRPR